MNQKPWRQRIVCDPEIHRGAPCMRGTRVAASVIVASFADLSMDELLSQYPQLSREDIQAALHIMRIPRLARRTPKVGERATASTKSFDVFLVYSIGDSDTARKVQQTLTEAGLMVWLSADVSPGNSIEGAIRDAIASSRAVVAILPESDDFSANALVELGAAMSWSKPIYLVASGNGSSRTPRFPHRYRIYPMSRLADVARN